MADKSIEQLTAAEKVNATDLFVLQQSGTAKKLTGQILLNWLTAAADGHGGIQSIAKLSTSGLADTYRITMADTTIFDFVVKNGRSITSITQTSVSGLTRTYTIAFNDGSNQTFTVTDGRSITGISKTSTSGLVDTYTISYNDGTSGTLTVTNGEKGDKGDNAYVWIKYASQEPTESSHSIGDIPDNWMGIYSGNDSTTPTDWKQYRWFKNKGEQGDTGSPATLLSKSVTYQVGDSGSIVPSGSWSSSVPVVPQGKYLWTKTELQFNTGDPIVSYSVARMGLDGSGSVSSVNNVSPDENGNVALNAEDVGALSSTGGDMTGELRMNGQTITGLNSPANANDAVSKAYADQMLPKSGGTMSGHINMGGNWTVWNLPNPVNPQEAATKGYTDTLVKTRRVHTAFGNLIKSEGGTVLGTGIATVTIDPNGLARIDFSIDITNGGTNADVWLYGISEALLRERNPNIPIITPITGGVINWYRYPEMTYLDSLAVYAAFPAASGGYWRIARIQTANGTWGDYPETCLSVNQRIIGTCYGTVEL